MAEARGFEPPRHCYPHDFESCAFNHSATLPSLFYHKILEGMVANRDKGRKDSACYR